MPHWLFASLTGCVCKLQLLMLLVHSLDVCFCEHHCCVCCLLEAALTSLPCMRVCAALQQHAVSVMTSSLDALEEAQASDGFARLDARLTKVGRPQFGVLFHASCVDAERVRERFRMSLSVPAFVPHLVPQTVLATATQTLKRG